MPKIAKNHRLYLVAHADGHLGAHLLRVHRPLDHQELALEQNALLPPLLHVGDELGRVNRGGGRLQHGLLLLDWREKEGGEKSIIVETMCVFNVFWFTLSFS
jgi:hypothetical protein